MRLGLSGLFIIALWVAGGEAALADAREDFRRGEAAYQRGDYELAIQVWQDAFKQDPRPLIQYNLAQAYERLGQLNKAVEALSAFVDTGSPNDPAYGDATARLQALRLRLAASGVVIEGGADGAAVEIDGTSWGRLPRPDKIALVPGQHRIVVRLAGYRDTVMDVLVPEGQELRVPVTLDPVAAAPAARTATAALPASPVAPERGEPRAAGDGSPLPWFIASGVLAAGGVGTGIWWANRASALSECEPKEIFCAQKTAVGRERNVAIAATVVLGAGAITALVVGLLNTGGDDQAEPQAALQCRPGLAGGRCQWTF